MTKTNLHKTTVIGFWGGPGCGKSTTAARLFGEMKVAGYECELVTEYAKDLLYADRHKEFGNQFYLAAKQYHRQYCLKDHVDYIITDCPILMNYVYHENPDYHLLQVLKRMHAEFNHINIVVDRSSEFKPKGRNKTEKQSIQLDTQIISLLDDLGLEYHHCANYDVKFIMDMLKNDKP